MFTASPATTPLNVLNRQSQTPVVFGVPAWCASLNFFFDGEGSSMA